MPYWISQAGVDQITFFFFLSMHWKSCRLLHCLISLCYLSCKNRIGFSQLLCLYRGLMDKRAHLFCVPEYFFFLLLHLDFPFLPVDSFHLPFTSEHIYLLYHGERRANWALNLNMWHQKTKWQCWQALDHPQALRLPSNWMWTELDAAWNRYPRAFINHTRTKCICGLFWLLLLTLSSVCF